MVHKTKYRKVQRLVIIPLTVAGTANRARQENRIKTPHGNHPYLNRDFKTEWSLRSVVKINN